MKDVIADFVIVALIVGLVWQLWSGFAHGVVYQYTSLRRDKSPVVFWFMMLVYAGLLALFGYAMIQLLLGHKAD